MSVLITFFYILLGWLGMAFACQAANGSVPIPLDVLGKEVVQRLTDRYYNVRENCGSEQQAAYLCAGVLIRATSSSTDFNTWEPNPDTVAAGRGMSFSYLSKRSPIYAGYIYKKGFIVYPAQQVPSGQVVLDFLCTFPIDGATSNRDQKGCGKHRLHEGSEPCFDQGISTADQFSAHYVREPKIKYLHQRQCSFSLLNGSSNNAAYAFRQMMLSIDKIPHISLNDQNELVAENPAASTTPEQWPIEAFFYTESAGLPGAQIDQRNYFNKAGIMVPIIKVTLAVRGQGDAVFDFVEEDQAKFQ